MKTVTVEGRRFRVEIENGRVRLFGRGLKPWGLLLPEGVLPGSKDFRLHVAAALLRDKADRREMAEWGCQVGRELAADVRRSLGR